VLFGQIVTALGLQALASTALLGLGGYLVIRGSLTLGQLVAAELIVTLVVGSVAKVGKHLENYYDLMAATDKVGKLLDLPVEDASGEVQVPVADVAGATLEVRDVTVLRPDGEPLLDHLNFTVEAGTSLGIQGPTGSGKSTLASLLWGLRRPDRGSIRLDGRSLRDLSLETLRRKTSLVAEAEVIGGTVRENVRIGRPFVTDDDVRDALERLGMLGGLDRLPGGLDCELNTRGWPLSGGELLLLQVARAIAGEPRLLIVSDMFLQLSGERRQRLLDTLFDPDAPWTLVVLSSAEDVLARCDQVLELPSCSLVAGGLEAAAAPAG
jgi:ABC-type multidrug transport system fused ATPase/permease subunit